MPRPTILIAAVLIRLGAAAFAAPSPVASWTLDDADACPPGMTVALNGDRFFSVKLAEPRRAPARAVSIFHAWNGMLSHVHVYNRALTAVEIDAVIKAESPADDLDSAALAPNIPDMTLDEVAFRTGYMVKEIKAFFPPIEQWGALGIEPKPETIADTYARERFKRPPAPYVHPRVYFGPEDLPRLLKHLQESQLARTQMELMRGRCLQISPNEKDWLEVPYGQKQMDAVYDDYLAKGMRINRRMGYHGPWVGGWINELAAGKDPEYLAGKWQWSSRELEGDSPPAPRPLFWNRKAAESRNPGSCDTVRRDTCPRDVAISLRSQVHWSDVVRKSILRRRHARLDRRIGIW